MYNFGVNERDRTHVNLFNPNYGGVNLRLWPICVPCPSFHVLSPTTCLSNFNLNSKFCLTVEQRTDANNIFISTCGQVPQVLHKFNLRRNIKINICMHRIRRRCLLWAASYTACISQCCRGRAVLSVLYWV